MVRTQTSGVNKSQPQHNAMDAPFGPIAPISAEEIGRHAEGLEQDDVENARIKKPFSERVRVGYKQHRNRLNAEVNFPTTLPFTGMDLMKDIASSNMSASDPAQILRAIFAGARIGKEWSKNREKLLNDDVPISVAQKVRGGAKALEFTPTGIYDAQLKYKTVGASEKSTWFTIVGDNSTIYKIGNNELTLGKKGFIQIEGGKVTLTGDKNGTYLTKETERAFTRSSAGKEMIELMKKSPLMPAITNPNLLDVKELKLATPRQIPVRLQYQGAAIVKDPFGDMLEQKHFFKDINQNRPLVLSDNVIDARVRSGALKIGQKTNLYMNCGPEGSFLTKHKTAITPPGLTGVLKSAVISFLSSAKNAIKKAEVQKESVSEELTITRTRSSQKR